MLDWSGLQNDHGLTPSDGAFNPLLSIAVSGFDPPKDPHTDFRPEPLPRMQLNSRQTPFGMRSAENAASTAKNLVSVSHLEMLRMASVRKEGDEECRSRV